MRKEKPIIKVNEKTKQLVYIIAFLFVAFFFVIWFHLRLNRAEVRSLSARDGVSVIHKLEKQKVVSVDDKIQKLEEKEEKEKKQNNDKKTVTKRFKNCLILGDSICEGLYEFDIMDSSLVIAEKGIHLNELESVMAKAENQNPKKIFLCYGMNDLESTFGNAEQFKAEYKKVLDEFRSKLPNCTIYVNSILPVQQVAIEKVSYNANWEEFNKVLQTLCKEEKITYIDHTSLVKASYYTKDGIHMNPPFYPVWINHMAEVAKL